jgi:cytochrome c5
MDMSFLRVWLLLTVIVLSGCGQSSSTASAFGEAQSRQLRPSAPELAAIYDRSCRSCHTLAATGAPLTGDTAAWAPRMDKGMDVLLQNVINGSGRMPPLGLCMDCTPEQFTVLIQFMASGE